MDRMLVNNLELSTPVVISSSENYPLIITDAKDTVHFFMFNEEGQMIYDGWDRPVNCEDDK